MPKKLSEEDQERVTDEHDRRSYRSKITGKRNYITEHMNNDDGLFDPIIDTIKRHLKRKAGGPEVEKLAQKKSTVPVWTTQYNRLVTTSSGNLKLLLQSYNKVVFSEGNIIKGLCKPGQREAPKEVLAKYVEYASDYDMHTLIPSQHRNLESMIEITGQTLHVERIEKLLLSLDNFDYPNGLWSFIDDREVSGEVRVKLNFSNLEPAVVPRTFEGDLTIENNWSFHNGVIREIGNAENKYICCWLFLGQTKAACKPMTGTGDDGDNDTSTADVGKPTTEVRVTTPTVGVKEPTVDVQEPKVVVKEPKVDVQTPNVDAQMPDDNEQTPKTDEQKMKEAPRRRLGRPLSTRIAAAQTTVTPSAKSKVPEKLDTPITNSEKRPPPVSLRDAQDPDPERTCDEQEKDIQNAMSKLEPLLHGVPQKKPKVVNAEASGLGNWILKGKPDQRRPPSAGGFGSATVSGDDTTAFDSAKNFVFV